MVYTDIELNPIPASLRFHVTLDKNNHNGTTALHLPPPVSFRSLPLHLPDPSAVFDFELRTQSNPPARAAPDPTHPSLSLSQQHVHPPPSLDPMSEQQPQPSKKSKGGRGRKFRKEDGKGQGNGGKEWQLEVNVIIDWNASECVQRERGD